MAGEILNVLELKAQLRESQIERLVHRFYERVQQDPLLAPAFASRIADDQWPAHLDKMVRFWSTILRGTDRYTGDPMAAHQPLAANGTFTSESLTRWLALFREVADDVLPEPALADSIVHRAERMGRALRSSLGIGG